MPPLLFRFVPDCDEARAARMRELGEQLDAQRKRQQAAHPRLTITEMYNVLAALRAGESLTDRERATHEQGLVSILRQLHDELDAEVCAAYGWPDTLADEELLQRLVALNAARAAEERAGRVRWLRPAFQHPTGATQDAFDEQAAAADTLTPARRARQPWPKSVPEQARRPAGPRQRRRRRHPRRTRAKLRARTHCGRRRTPANPRRPRPSPRSHARSLRRLTRPPGLHGSGGRRIWANGAFSRHFSLICPLGCPKQPLRYPIQARNLTILRRCDAIHCQCIASQRQCIA
jgi:hypothetical protein